MASTWGVERRSRRGRRRALAIGAALIAVSALAGALGLATGADPYLTGLEDRLPFESPVFGAAALAVVVGLPNAVLARWAWTGHPATDRLAVAAGALLVGWIGIELVIVQEPHWIEGVFATAGALVVLAGVRGGIDGAIVTEG